MDFCEWKKWRVILFAICCAIIILSLAILGISGSSEHSIANMYFIPAGIFTIGTCGSDTMPMNYSTEIQPAFELSFLHEFGEPEPDRNLTLPPLHSYAERQVIIDTLMNQARINDSADSVIGIYEFPDARLLLVSRDTDIIEVFETGDRIQTFNLTSVPVGSRRNGDNSMNTLQQGSYNLSSDSFIAIDRVGLVLPLSKNGTAPLYIVNKTDVDRVFYVDERPLASITSRSTFYVLYGQRVERIIGTSTIKLDPAWKQCSPHTEISGEGRRQGDIQHTVKIARGPDRILWSRLIVISADIQWHDNGEESTSEWTSSDSTGCSC
jgi:hypothetical protein